MAGAAKVIEKPRAFRDYHERVQLVSALAELRDSKVLEETRSESD